MSERVSRPVVQFLSYGAGSIIGSAVNMAALPLISRHLDAGGYGTYSLGFVFFSLLVLLFDLGLIQGLIRFLPAEDKRTASPVLGTVLTTVILSASLLGVPVLLLARPLAVLVFGQATASEYIIICTAAAWSAVVFQTGLAWLRSRLRPVPHLVVTTVRALLFLGLVYGFVPGAGDKLRILFLCWMVPYIPGALAALIMLVKNAGRPDPALLKRMLGYSLPLVPSALIMWLLTHIDMYLLRALASTSDVGLYTLASQICMLPMPVIVAVQMGWLPFILSLPDPDRDRVSPVFMTMTTAALGICSLLILYAEDLVRLLSTAPFLPAARAVLPLAVSATWYILYLLSSTGLHLSARTSVLPFITLGAAAVNIILNILIIPRYGFTGAAWTTVVSGSCLALATLAVSRHAHPLRFPWRLVLRAAVPAGLAIAGWQYRHPAGTVASLALKTALMAGILLCWKVTGIFKHTVGPRFFITSVQEPSA